MFKLTAAHRSLPIPCYARVTHLHSGREVIVRINDRGPFHDNRIIDLSYAAAVKLGFHEHGTAPVRVEVIDARSPMTVAQTENPRPAETPTPAVPMPQPDVPASAATGAATPSATPSGTPTATGAGVFLQAGAFAQRDAALNTALRIREYLHDLSLPVSTAVVTNDADTLYRVHIGPVADQQTAQRVRLLVSRDFAPPLILP